MYRFFAAVLLVAFSVNANALSILLSGGSSERDLSERLTSMGHTVVYSQANFWTSTNTIYKDYDVVALHTGTNEVADIDHLLTAVQKEEVGVVFFRGTTFDGLYEVPSATAIALGMGDGIFTSQFTYAQDSMGNNTDTSIFDIIDTSHPITQGMSLGINDLGYTYMSLIPAPGVDTTVLANGADGAALVVHNSFRVAITPFYGHPDGYDDETALATQLTENTLQWAAGMTVVPIPAAVWLFGSALAGLGWIRRKQTV
jgi:hypothetical protein